MTYPVLILCGALVGSATAHAQGPYICPTEREVANIEVGASSRFIGMPERDFLLQNAQALRGCQVKLTPQEWRTLKAYHAAQNNLQAADRRLARIEANRLIGNAMTRR